VWATTSCFRGVASLDYRIDTEVKKKLREFVVAVVQEAGFDHELRNFESHPERLDDLISVRLLADGISVRSPQRKL
jgi:hypothetical protein